MISLYVFIPFEVVMDKGYNLNHLLLFYKVSKLQNFNCGSNLFSHFCSTKGCCML
jgi:hypothetical protein